MYINTECYLNFKKELPGIRLHPGSRFLLCNFISVMALMENICDSEDSGHINDFQ